MTFVPRSFAPGIEAADGMRIRRRSGIGDVSVDDA